MSYIVANVAQGTDPWHEWRKTGATATDAVVVMDESPFKTWWRAWAEKTGFASPEDIWGNPYVRRGALEEHKIRAAVEAKHDVMLLPVCVQSKQYGYIIASLDGLSAEGIPYELKYPSEKNWLDVCANGVNAKAYKMYFIQVQHQLLATGADHGFLVFYQQGKLKEFRIEADPLVQAQILIKARLLMHFVETRTAPKKDPEKDLFIPEGEVAKSWLFFSEKYKEIQAKIDVITEKKAELEERIGRLKEKQEPSLAKLKKFSEGYKYADYGGVQLTQYASKGAVDVGAMIEGEGLSLTDDVVNKYRKASKPQCRVKVKESLTPKLINDENVLAPIQQHVQQQADDLYF